MNCVMKFQEILNLDRVVFYDGTCGFCNGIVKFILKRRKTDFYFIALQSKTAQKMLANYNIKINMNTLYLIENKKLYDRSTAVLHIFKNLKLPHSILYYGGHLIPKFIRDYIYSKISKYRHRVRAKNCFLPTQKERRFFID